MGNEPRLRGNGQTEESDTVDGYMSRQNIPSALVHSDGPGNEWKRTTSRAIRTGILENHRLDQQTERGALAAHGQSPTWTAALGT